MPILTIGVVFSFAPEAEALIEKLITALSDKPTTPPKRQLFFKGGGFVRTYAQDRPADTVQFQKPKVVDSEGGEVNPQPELSYTFSSDDESMVTIVDNGDGTVTLNYGTAQKLDDGSFKICEIRAESNDIDLSEEGILKDVKTEQIQLVPGSAAGFAGGGFQLPE